MLRPRTRRAGVPARAPQALRTRGPGAPTPGRGLGTRRAPEHSATGSSGEGAPQEQLAEAAEASRPFAAGRTGAAGRWWGRQAPPQQLAPAVPPAFRARSS